MTTFLILTWCREHIRISTTATCISASIQGSIQSRSPRPKSHLPTRPRPRRQPRRQNRPLSHLKSSHLTRQKSLWTPIRGELELQSHPKLLRSQLLSKSQTASVPKLMTPPQLKAQMSLSSYSMSLGSILLSGARPSSSNARSRAFASSSARKKKSLVPSARLCLICAHYRTMIAMVNELKNTIKKIFDQTRPGWPVGRRTSPLFASPSRHWLGSFRKITALKTHAIGFGRLFISDSDLKLLIVLFQNFLWLIFLYFGVFWRLVNLKFLPKLLQNQSITQNSLKLSTI